MRKKVLQNGRRKIENKKKGKRNSMGKSRRNWRTRKKKEKDDELFSCVRVMYYFGK